MNINAIVLLAVAVFSYAYFAWTLSEPLQYWLRKGELYRLSFYSLLCCKRGMTKNTSHWIKFIIYHSFVLIPQNYFPSLLRYKWKIKIVHI
jgi:hypothetical protein